MKRLSIFSEYSLSDLEELLAPLVRNAIKAELQAFKPLATDSPDVEQYLTRKEVGVLLKISYPTISKLDKAGVLKGKIVGGSYRYRTSDVYKFFNQGKASHS